MELLIKSSRCIKHMNKERELTKSGEAEWKMNIVVREWNEIQPELEFRGFVFQRELTALSHYYKFCYVSGIADDHQCYLERIMEYFHQVKDSLPDNCVIDFCFTISNEIRIVELNPWSVNASGALFDWNIPEDLAIMEGRAPFQFRYLHVPPSDVMEKVSPTLRMLWYMARPLRYEEGEQLPRGKSRFTFSFPKPFKLPFRKDTAKYTFVKDLTIDWEKIFSLAVHCNSAQDHIPRVFWVFSLELVNAVGFTHRVVQSPSENPHSLSTLLVILAFEIAVANSKHPERDPVLTKLLPLMIPAYQWLADAYKLFESSNSVTLSLEVQNFLLTLTNVWQIINPIRK